MPASVQTIEAPLTRDQLVARWQALCKDPTFEDVAAKIELTEWGEILMSPVGKQHGLLAARAAQVLQQALGGHTIVEVGISTAIGVRAPDVAWCSDAFLAAHPEDMPLSGAPEICVEIWSASNPLPKLREKATAYVNAGAVEAWILLPEMRRSEIYGRSGRLESSSFAVNIGALFD
jgi:Uma2 family endonuclease